MSELTPEQALRAMFFYLTDYWRQFNDAAVTDVLGDIQPAEAGETSDHAAWDDWMNSVGRVVDGTEGS
jgi:hypothetical protein